MKTISDIKSDHIAGSEAESVAAAMKFEEHLKKLYESSKCSKQYGYKNKSGFNHRGYL